VICFSLIQDHEITRLGCHYCPRLPPLPQM
jgi:hypothetical protein